jgi:hypothetical protein
VLNEDVRADVALTSSEQDAPPLSKARVGRTRKTCADLEQQLKACRQEIAHARQRLRVLLYAVSLGLLLMALRLGQRLWTRTLRIRRLVDANIIGIFIWDFEGRIP